MLDIEVYKIADAGHFWCKPSSRTRAQADQYYTLIGQINDHCSRVYDQTNSQRLSIPKKGEICLVKRTSDRCWYRAKLLSVFQTINGPQASVLLVDLGERTLIPGLWVHEIPEEFLAIPFQTMECVPAGLKPITLVTSYFDLTTTKQQGDSWDVSATEWFQKEINGCSLQMEIKHIDEDGVHYVVLFATGAAGMICINDELINKEFAVLSRTIATINQDQTNTSSSDKDRTQDVFEQEHKEIIEQLNSNYGVDSDMSDSSDSFKHPSFLKGMGHKEAQSKMKYQSMVPSPQEVPPRRNGTELAEPISARGPTSDDDGNKVRFLSARLPATGSSPFSDTSPGTKTKPLRPILKTSSGYSSSEQEEFFRNTPRVARLPKNVGDMSMSGRSSFAHDPGSVGVAPERDQRGKFLSVAQQGNVASLQRNQQNATGVSSSSAVPSKFQDAPQTLSAGFTPIARQSTRLPHNSSVRNAFEPSWSPDLPCGVSQSPCVPTSNSLQYQSISTPTSSRYPRLPTSPPQSTRVPTSPLQSTRVPTSPLQSTRIPTSPLQSTRVPTSPLQSTRVPTSPLQSARVPTPSPSHYPDVPTSTSVSPRVPTSDASQHQSLTPSPSQYRGVPTSPSPSTRTPTPSPSRSPRVASSPMPCPNLCHLSRDVFIHGEGLPRPVLQIDSNIFSEGVLRVLRDMCVTAPSSFQSSVWPAIMRGRDVCGIPGTNAESSLAYLLPVVTQITESAAYSELPLGNGPLALILCSGWRKAATVYELCCKLTKQNRNIRVQVLFGAGAEDEHILHLINGCEVIIATLPCFLRMLKKGYTRLDRLCHLVFDDADVLAEERTEGVKELMREYGGLLTSQPNRLAPRQCIAMANKWTPGVCSLVKAYLGNPLIIIANHIETAMFCKVRQTAQYVTVKKRDSHLIGLLDSLTVNVDHEIIIFTSAAKDAERLSELLQYYSYSVLLAHEFIWPEKLLEIRRQWNTPHSAESYPVLVMTDGVIDKCNVRNASCVIHYDFASSKTLFGKRLFCMAASYPSTKERECLSMMLGTEAIPRFAQSMQEITTRAGGEVSNDVKSVNQMAFQSKEASKKKFDLCYFLKAFGVCTNYLTCKERHSVYPDVDVSLLLPRSGIVKVLVLTVLDASRYYVRILEHQCVSKEADTDGSNYYSGATFLKLALDLNAWYASPNNRCICGIIQPRKLCVAHSEGSFHRVLILRVVQEDAETNRALEVELYFVDRGHYEEVSTRYLFEIAPQFVEIPHQAVEAFVCRVKPVDEDKDWTKKSYRFVQQHIEGEELEGKVVMGLRNTIWFDPLVAKKHLKEINVTTNTFNVRMDLLKEGLAIPNPKHIENLRQEFEKFVTLKQLTGQENSERSLTSVLHVDAATLPEEGYEMVKVSAVVTPGLLYVRLDANSNSLEDLVDEINSEMTKPSTCKGEELGIGSLCVARFTEDDRWYRGKIFSIRPEGEYDVFYVDYGDREWVSKERIVPAWSDILQFPFQAIECCLVNISPIENEWTEQDGDVLWDMTEDKLLYVKVKSKSAAMSAGTSRYGIELYDTSTERDVLMNHELIIAGHAQATLGCHKALFPEAFESINSGEPKESFKEIPEICLQLYKSQNPNEKLQCAKEIKNIVSENMRKKDAIRESGGVRCICRLLGVSKLEAVQENIVVTLAFLGFQNEQNCDEIRREGGLKALCHLLTKAKSVKTQEHTVWALKNIATTQRNQDATREFGGIGNLCDLLKSTGNEKVQENICWAIVAVCADNNKNCDTVREAGGLDAFFSLLKTATSDSVLENVMWAISLLACNGKNKKLIGEQGGIEIICTLIKDNRNEKVFKNAVRALKTLSSYNDENRATMCRLGVIDVMRRLTSVPNGLPFDTRRVCLDLIQRLLGRAPDIPLVEASSIASSLQEPIMLKPIYVTKKKRKSVRQNGGNVNSDDDDLPPLEDTTEAFLPAVHPMTMWSQTKRFVTLSIKLRGVLHKDKVTNITEKSFYFRTKHMGKLYELDLELFANVLPKDCKVHTRGSEVLVNLKKAQPSTWKRLLHSPHKPPYLSVDFDRWDTDSSNEGDTPAPRVRVPFRMPSTKTSTKLDYTMPPEDGNESESEITDDEEHPREQFFDFT